METNKKKAICAKCKVVHSESGTAFKMKGKYYCKECLPKEEDNIKRCSSCKKPLEDDDTGFRTEKGKKVYYCSTCLEIRNREAKAHYDLVDYIYQKHDYKHKGIGGEYVVAQIKVLKNMYPHYKEGGMLASLKYYYEVLNNDIHPNPFKLIPYIYDEAKLFYEKRREIKMEYLKIKEQKPLESKPRIIKSRPHEPRTKVKYIDLDSL